MFLHQAVILMGQLQIGKTTKCMERVRLAKKSLAELLQPGFIALPAPKASNESLEEVSSFEPTNELQ